MKTKVLILLASGLLALTAWYVHQNGAVHGSEHGQTRDDDVNANHRDTIHKALEFLAKQQHKDVHWEGDEGKHPVAMTGLVGLALLMEGRHPIEREGAILKLKYGVELRKAADWLVSQHSDQRDGLFFSGHSSETNRYMEGHGLATLFLAGVHQYEFDKARLKKQNEALANAVKYLGKARSSQGGWYHTSKVEGHDFDDVGATALQFQALQAAQNAGVQVTSNLLSDAKEYLKGRIDRYASTKDANAHQRGHDLAAALLCLHIVDRRGSTDPWWLRRIEECQAKMPMGRDVQFGRDELTHYFYAQIAHKLKGESWKSYRESMFDHLHATQRKDGSWPPGQGLGVGSVYSTAIWCIIMQLPNGHHPTLQYEYQRIR